MVAIAAVVVGLTITPGALADHDPPSTATCAGLKPLPPPPSLYADPECLEEDLDNPFHVEPTLEVDLNVHVVWTYDRPDRSSDVDSFTVFRGTAPGGLYAIGEVDARGTWEFEDDWQFTGSGAVWYAVEAEHSDGSVEMSQAYLVQPASQ